MKRIKSFFTNLDEGEMILGLIVIVLFGVLIGLLGWLIYILSLIWPLSAVTPFVIILIIWSALISFFHK